MKESSFNGKILIFLICVFFLTITIEPICLASTGVLLMVKGKVNIKSHGAVSPARSGLRLNPGTTVYSLKGTATILVSDGEIYNVGKGSNFTLREGEERFDEDSLFVKLMDTIREIANRGRGQFFKSTKKDEKEISLVYPFNSFINFNRIQFEWVPLKEIRETEVILKSPSPAYKYSFIIKSEKNKVVFPKEAPPLVPGTRYYWRVKGYEGAKLEPYISKLCWFSVLDMKKSEQLEADMKKIDKIKGLGPEDKEFLRANLFILYGLYHNAVGIFQKSFKKFPGDAGIKELLTGLLIKMKNFEEAEKLIDREPEEGFHSEQEY